jgi:hypothetical protein
MYTGRSFSIGRARTAIWVKKAKEDDDDRSANPIRNRADD